MMFGVLYQYLCSDFSSLAIEDVDVERIPLNRCEIFAFLSSLITWTLQYFGCCLNFFLLFVSAFDPKIRPKPKAQFFFFPQNPF